MDYYSDIDTTLAGPTFMEECCKDGIRNDILNVVGKKLPSENSYNAIAKNMGAQYFELDYLDELVKAYSGDEIWIINDNGYRVTEEGDF